MLSRILPLLILSGLLFGFVVPTSEAETSATRLLGSSPSLIKTAQLQILGGLAPTNQLYLTLGLPLRDEAGLSNCLAGLYNPGSPTYRQFLTPQEFTARFAPTAESYSNVLQYVAAQGWEVRHTHPNRLLVDVVASVAQVEPVLKVKFNNYWLVKDQRKFFAPDQEPQWSGPVPLLHISGLDNFQRPQSLMRPVPAGLGYQAYAGTGPGGSYLGNDFRQAYLPGCALTGSGQSVALVQFDGFYPADITNYAVAAGMTNGPPNIVVVPIDGGITNPGIYEKEVALDIEMVMAMAPGIANIYVYEAPNVFGTWEDVMSKIANDNLARQVSSSWAGGGPNPAGEILLQQMAAQGQTYFNASGDDAASIGPRAYPTESPNATLVGGTTLTTDTNGAYLAETVWNWGSGNGSSGGV
ncbi:MAG TPA: protease pro-enzyme activation domain-containing protein, partial [Verrucomicrobiae bacterium]